MKKSVIKKIIKHLDKISVRPFPEMTRAIPWVLTTEEVVSILDLDDDPRSVLNYWEEINEKIKSLSHWELFQPFPHGKWVFWDTSAITDDLWQVTLSNDEFETLNATIVANTKNRVSQNTWSRSGHGNHEHLRVIKHTQKKDGTSRVSIQNALLVHLTLSQFVLSNGVAPLSFSQLRSMTNLSLRHIGSAVKLLEQAGLWFTVRGFKGKRGTTRFISLSHSFGYGLALHLRDSEQHKRS